MLLIMYQIFSSLLGHLPFLVHFFLHFYGVTFFGTPNMRTQKKTTKKLMWTRTRKITQNKPGIMINWMISFSIKYVSDMKGHEKRIFPFCLQQVKETERPLEVSSTDARHNTRTRVDQRRNLFLVAKSKLQ